MNRLFSLQEQCLLRKKRYKYNHQNVGDISTKASTLKETFYTIQVFIMANSSFKTVTVGGAVDNLGYHITGALLNDGSYKVKVLRQGPKDENEKATLLASRGAEIVYIDYHQHDTMVQALKGTDVFISAISPASTGGNHDMDAIQSPLLAAAKDAGVKRFIPSEFGIDYRYNFVTINLFFYFSRRLII
jgi:hypothetical protein